MVASVYSTDTVEHDADKSVPLKYGIVRYEASDDVPVDVRKTLPAKNDRPFVYVPVGYPRREPNHVKKILAALELELPNLVITCAETETVGRKEMESLFQVLMTMGKKHPANQNQLSKEHTQTILVGKVRRLLETVAESSAEVRAWLLPEYPRRRNGAAQMVCELFPRETNVSLGMIGLEDDKEDVTFKNSLLETMEPLGSPLNSVCKLKYGINLTDGAPCPQLSHLLIFESAEEQLLFRKELLDLVPDYTIAFGNITTNAMIRIFESTKVGSPIVLLQHTGNNVDSMCKMYRHVNKHLAKMKKQAAAASTATNNIAYDHNNVNTNAPVDSDTVTALAALPPSSSSSKKKRVGDSTANTIPLLDETNVPGKNNKLVNLFLNTWPAGYDPVTVVVADPLVLDGETLQKRVLAALTAAFDLKSGTADTRATKRRALNYAWSLRDVCADHAARKRWSAYGLHGRLVLFTLVSIVASIYYERTFGTTSPSTSHYQLFVFVSTVLVPLYITSLKQESNAGAAYNNWGVFSRTAAKIESEIYKFRAQVGPYRVEEKTEIALHQSVQNFVNKIRADLLPPIQSHLTEDGMRIPKDFWDFDVDKSGGGDDDRAKDAKSGSGLLPPAGGGGTTTTKDFLDDGVDPVVTETTPMLAATPNKPTYDVEAQKGDDAADSDSDSDDDDDEDIGDDRYSPLTADDYVRHRLSVAMHERAERVNDMVVRNRRFHAAVKSVTIGSGAFAALSLQWAVPIVLAVTAALGSSQDFGRYPSRIAAANNLVMRLNALRLWWMGLSMYQSQLPHNKEHLITTGECILNTEIEQYFDGGGGGGEGGHGGGSGGSSSS